LFLSVHTTFIFTSASLLEYVSFVPICVVLFSISNFILALPFIKSTNPKQNPAIQTIQKINHLNDFLVLGSLSPNMPPITLYLCLSLSFFFFSVCFFFFFFFFFSFFLFLLFFFIFLSHFIFYFYFLIVYNVIIS